jgi:hypothetical protein
MHAPVQVCMNSPLALSEYISALLQTMYCLVPVANKQ